MSQALSFNDVSLVPVPVNNNDSVWLRASDIAKALGYQREDKVSRLYQRNADEFTPDMTQVIEITADPHFGTEKNLSDGRCRIFSLRGCHLLAMFSRTPVAKAFRKWVLDVLDRLAEEEQAALPHGDTLTAAEQATILTPSTADDRKPLRSLVAAWAQVSGTPHQALWPQVKAHFQLARIDDLPLEWIGDALAFVQGKIDAAGKALPEGKPAHVFKRMGLTPIEELQMGTSIKQMLEGLDVDKIGPRTMECLMLKAKYASAILEVYRLNRELVQDLDRIAPSVSGQAMKALNKMGCFSDPVADTLYEPRYRLDRINEEYRAAALAALNSNICLARMLGI